MSKLIGTLATALLAALTVSPACAERRQDPQAQARISPPTERLERVVAGGHVWRCRGDTCVGRVPRDLRGQRFACRRLGLTFAILSFEVAGAAFADSDLRFCNRNREVLQD